MSTTPPPALSEPAPGFHCDGDTDFQYLCSICVAKILNEYCLRRDYFNRYTSQWVSILYFWTGIEVRKVFVNPRAILVGDRMMETTSEPKAAYPLGELLHRSEPARDETRTNFAQKLWEHRPEFLRAVYAPIKTRNTPLW